MSAAAAPPAAQQPPPASYPAVSNGTSNQQSVNVDNLACQWNNCSERAQSPEALYDHVCEKHVGRKSTNNLNLQCHWGSCRTTTVKRDHITSHIRVHIPLKPHKCDYCGKSFKRPQDLKKHVKTHADDSVLMRSPGQDQRMGQQGMDPYGNPHVSRAPMYDGVSNGAYGYSAATTNGHHMPAATHAYGPGPTATAYGMAQHGGPEYGLTESRKRQHDAIDQFFGDVKRNRLDAFSYQDLNTRLGGMQGLPFGMSTGYGNAGYGGGGYGTGVRDDFGPATYAQPQHVPAMQAGYGMSFPELKTKNDLVTIDNFLEQLTNTTYEHGHAFDRTGNLEAPYGSVNQSPRMSDVNSTNGSSVSGDTPALTPNSHMSSHSPSSVHSGYAAPAQPRSHYYPSLQQQTGYHDPTSSLPPSGLDNSTEEYAGNRRWSGGQLWAARRDSSSTTVPGPTRDRRPSASEESDEAHSAAATPTENKSVKLPSLTRRATGSSDSTTSSDDQKSSWIDNMRVIEALRDFVKMRLQNKEYDDEDGEGNKTPRADRDSEGDHEMGGSGKAKKGESLYPPLPEAVGAN